jgi:hypothetical protein
MAQDAVARWVAAPPDQVVEEGFRALAAGSACSRALAGLPIAPLRKRHLLALADGFETLSKLPHPTSEIAREIAALRQASAAEPTNQQLRDELFNVESRTQADQAG